MTAAPERSGTDRGIGRPPWWFVAAVLLIVAAVTLLVYVWPAERKPVRLSAPSPGWTLEPVLSITGPGTGPQPRFDRPLAAAFGPDGDIYVSDTNHGRICVFTVDGRFKQEIGRLGNRASRLQMPVGLSVDASGGVLVADLQGGVVRRFGPGGQPAPSLQQPVTKWRPTDVAVSGDGIYVTDEMGVRRFTLKGRYAGALPATAAGGFEHPNGVAVTPAGTLIVSDTNDYRVLSMTRAGKVLWATGQDNVLALPRGVGVDDQGRVVVADAFGFDIAVLAPDGTLITKVGARGTAPGQFSYPNDVDVRGDLLLVTDKENDRIQLVRLVPPPPH